jgi:C-terminal processing protease CtpA/Prc
MDEIVSDGTKSLVIDLRGNEGGLDCGHEIIARLIDRPVSARLYDRRVRYRDVPQQLIPYLDTWDRSFDHLGAEARDIGNGFYQLPLNGEDQILPKGQRFTGKVAVLTEPMNSSATFNFAVLMRTYGLGKLVGGPTGGNQRGINGGAFYFLRLPASGLEVDVPLIGYFPQTPRPDAGVTPDIAIMPTARDIAKGRDPVLERALQAVG